MAEIYVRSNARPDESVDALERIWYSSTDGKSELIYWVRLGQSETDPSAIERFELYLGKEGVVWTPTGLNQYVEERKEETQTTSDLMNYSPMLKVWSGVETVDEFLSRLKERFDSYATGLPVTLRRWIEEQIARAVRIKAS